jgi:hypothetical protein
MGVRRLGGIVLAAGLAAACGSGARGGGFVGDGGSRSGGGEDGGPGSFGDDGGLGSFGGDGGNPQSGCTNLQCRAADCASQGKPETALTGTIRDPAGKLPLYNVYVYVPNATPAPITPGHPTCTPCQAPASGNPVIGASTDANGKFTLQKGPNDPWGVPVGNDIPLVIQVGKWRRQLVVPQIDPCTTNDLDSVLGPDKLRLPKKGSEGDMPLIALTTGGYDAFECFLRVVGVDDSEFGPPNGSGHVHVYTGANSDPSTAASSINGGNTVQDTWSWWSTASNLLDYDFVLNGCDGVPAGSRGGGYQAMEAYLNGGGRAFVTDFFVDWFSPPSAPGVYSQVASWPGWDGATQYGNYFADTSFPKGKAFGDWLVANGIGTPSGSAVQIPLTDTYPDVASAGPPTYPGSTRWIYNADAAGNAASTPSYMSFNTPIGTPTAQQCGRAVFSGVHVYLPETTTTFPGECGPTGGPSSPYGVNQRALEFLFFDLSSCVQNDQQPPPPPTPVQ